MKLLKLTLLMVLVSAPWLMAEQPQIVYPPDANVVDITKPPYNAKGDGVTDDTAAINRALRDHNAGHNPRDNFMSWTIYFPAGTYLVSNTLEPKDPKNRKKNQSAVRFVGESRDKTVIKLKDNAEKYQRPERPRYVIRTGNRDGRQPNCGYANYIQHLTVDTGKGNPGAIGVRFDVANSGAMDNVRILSSDDDKIGYAGLAFKGVCGLGYVKNLTIEGFDRGVYLDRASVNNIAFENLNLRDQRLYGIENVAKNIQILGLTSQNKVPALALKDPLAVTFLVNAELKGSDGAGPAAIVTESPEAFLYLREVKTSGYPKAVQSAPKAPRPAPDSLNISEWWSHVAPFMEGKEPKSLRLPIKSGPEYYNTDLSQWANVEDFGATKDNPEDDDALGIQKAIDSGKPVVYFPRGVYTLKSDVQIRGAVRKIDFVFSRLDYPIRGDYEKQAERAQAQHSLAGAPGFVVGEVEADAVILENLSQLTPIIQNGSKTLVIRNRGGSHRGVITVGDQGSGDLFVENAGPHATVVVRNGVHAWLRAINREKSGMTNDGSTVWSFADNIETMHRRTGDKKVLPLKTINGGTSEIIGACIDPLAAVHQASDGSIVLIENSTVSFNGAGEIRTRKGKVGGWPVVIQDTNGGKTTTLTQSDVLVWPTQADEFPKRLVVPLYRVDQPVTSAANHE